MAEFSSPIMGGLRVARNRFTPYSVLGRSAASEDNAQTVEVLSNNQRSLENINSSLVNVSIQISQLNASLGTVTDLLVRNSELDQVKDAQEANQQRLLAQQKLREGKESLVERKIQSALIAPIQKVGAKAQFALSNLMDFFGILLAGWLTNQVLSNFEFYSEKAKEIFKSISNAATSTFNVIGNIFQFVKSGFETVSNTITRIASLLSQATFGNLLRAPFDFLISKLQEYWNKIATRINESGVVTFLNDLARKIPNFEGNLIEFPTFEPVTNKEENNNTDSNTNNTQNEDTKAQEKTNSVAKSSNLNLANVFNTNAATSQNFTQGLNLSDNFFSDNSNVAQNYTSDINFGNNLFTGDMSNLSISASMFGGEKSEGEIPTQPTQPDFKAVDTSSKAQVSAPPKSDRIAKASQTEPEQQTQVIVTPAPAPTQQAQQKVPAVGGYASQLPAIASSNPDNFYALYSQVNYNVV